VAIMARRRRLAGLSLVLVLALTIPACFGPGDGRKPVTFASWGATQDFRIYRQLYDIFEAENADLRVSPMYIPFGNYFTKVQLLMVGHVEPDVLLVSSRMADVLRRNGHLQSLQPFIDRERVQDPTFLTEQAYYIDMLRPACTFNGEFYYLPIGPMTLHMYYNKTLFEKAGVPLPGEGWTWDDFLDAARRLTVSENGKTTQWGFLLDIWLDIWQVFLWQNGAAVWDDSINPTRCVLDTPEAIETFQFLQDLIYKYHVAPAPVQRSQLSGDFMSGHLAMQIHGTWMIEQFRQITDFEWDIAPLPMRKEYANQVTVAGVAMAAGTESPDDTWRLARFMFSDTAQRLMCSECAIWQPTKRSLVAEGVIDKVPGVPEHHYLRFTELQRARPSNVMRNPESDLIESTLVRDLEPIFTGKEMPATCITRTVPKINALIRKGLDEGRQ